MRFLIAIATLISVTAFGQKSFTGTYFTSKKDIGFESDIFQFEKDGTFSYVFFTCTGTGLGKGRYEITAEDSLRLRFSDCEKCPDLTELETFTGPSEKIEIDLQIKTWEDNSPIPGVNVYFPNTSIGTASDGNGVAQISTAKFTEAQKLVIQFIGYDPVEIEIPAEYSKVKGTVRLTYHWVYSQDDVMTFKIESRTNSKLKLRRYPNLSITYNKVASTKTDKLIEARMGESGIVLYKKMIAARSNAPSK